MATESIGVLIPTAIPGYSDSADIQAALRAYHYGSYSYDPANTSAASLVAPSIAKTIYDIQQDITTLENERTLNDLTDVTITTATSNQVLLYNGTSWINSSSPGVSTSANYTWTGIHTFQNTLTAQNGTNNFLNPSARDTAIPSPAAGTVCFVRQDAIGNTINQVQYYSGSAWVSTTTSPTLNNPILIAPEERWSVSATAATGTINLDVLTSGILYYTSNSTGNWTLNIRGSSTTSLNDVLTTNDSITAVFFATNGATPYYQTAFTIDGASITPKWQNASAPTSGNANSIDIYSFTIVKTGNATFTAFGVQTRFA